MRSRNPGFLLIALVACSSEKGGDSGVGTADGGASDGGASDGGASDGGASDGGASDGGASDGGASDGGASDGGSTDGGTEDGGAEVVLPDLVINEFMASNESAWSPDGESHPDWIELVNLGEEAVDLGGYGITDDLAEPHKHRLPHGLEIAAGGFLVLVADGSEAPADVYLPFKLSASGEELGLFTQDGIPLDQLRFGAQQTDFSAARAVDGDEDSAWIYVAGGTPGRSNSGE